MNHALLLLASLASGCGATGLTLDAGFDSGSPDSGSFDAGARDAGALDSVTADAGPCAGKVCSTSAFACDPADGQCKPDGTTTHVGAACDRTGPGDPKCGTYAKAICNDLINDDFPGGYCSVEPCTTVSLCPIGSSCGSLGAETPGCYLDCKSDADCRGPEYKCQPMDQLAVSGASRRVCYLTKMACVAPSDCPSSRPRCVAKVCSP